MLFVQFNYHVLMVYRAEGRDLCAIVLALSIGQCVGDPRILQQL